MTEKYYPSLISGFGVAVILSFPGAKNFACCLFVPLAAAISIFLYRRSTNSTDKLQTGTGLMLGFLTGLFAAFFSTGLDTIITLVTKSNDLIKNFPEAESILRQMKLGEAGEESIALIKKMMADVQQHGFSLLLTLMMLITNLISYILFGLVGGVAATAIINNRLKNSK